METQSLLVDKSKTENLPTIKPENSNGFREEIVEITYEEICKIQSDQERCVFKIKPLFVDDIDSSDNSNENRSGNASEGSSNSSGHVKFKMARNPTRKYRR